MHSLVTRQAAPGYSVSASRTVITRSVKPATARRVAMSAEGASAGSTAVTIRKLKAVPITPENFKPFGQVGLGPMHTSHVDKPCLHGALQWHGAHRYMHTKPSPLDQMSSSPQPAPSQCFVHTKNQRTALQLCDARCNRDTVCSPLMVAECWHRSLE
jgi:hypothetical protein